MAWSKDSLLGIGAEDNRITVMSSSGSVLQRCDTNETPRNLKFSEMKREKRGAYEEGTVSYHGIEHSCSCATSRSVQSLERSSWACGTSEILLTVQLQHQTTARNCSRWLSKINTATSSIIDGRDKAKCFLTVECTSNVTSLLQVWRWIHHDRIQWRLFHLHLYVPQRDRRGK